MFCLNCGKTLPLSDVAFCPHCGKPIEAPAPAQPAQAAAPTPVEAPAPAFMAQPAPVEAPVFAPAPVVPAPVAAPAPVEAPAPAFMAQPTPVEAPVMTAEPPLYTPPMPAMEQPMYTPPPAAQPGAYTPYNVYEPEAAPAAPVKKKKGKVLAAILLAAIVLLGSLGGVAAFFFRPEVKMLFSSKQEYMFQMESGTVKRLFSALGQSSSDAIPAYDLLFKVSNLKGAEDAGIPDDFAVSLEGSVDLKNLYVDLLLNATAEGESFELPVKADGKNLFLGLEEMAGENAYLPLPDISGNAFELLTEKEARHLEDVYIKDCIIGNIPDEAMTYEKEMVGGKNLRSLTVTLTPAILEDIFQSVGKQLEDDEVVIGLIKRIYEQSMGAEALLIAGDMDPTDTVNSLAEELQGVDADDMGKFKLSYTVCFTNSEEVQLRRFKLDAEGTANDVIVELETTEGHQLLSVKAGGEQVLRLENTYTAKKSGGSTAYKGNAKLTVSGNEIGKLTYDITVEPDMLHLPVGTAKLTVNADVAGFDLEASLTTKKDGDVYVSTVEVTVDGVTYGGDLTMSIKKRGDMSKPGVDISGATNIQEDSSALDDLFGNSSPSTPSDSDWDDWDDWDDYDDWDDWDNYSDYTSMTFYTGGTDYYGFPDGYFVLDETNVVSAEVLEDYDDYFLVLTFDEAGTESLADATEQQAAANGTISVWLNGEMIMNPPVYEAITEGSCTLTFDDMSRDELQALADFLNR